MSNDFVRGILGNLFGSSSSKNKAVPLVSGKLVRNDKFQNLYKQWLISDDRKNELGSLVASFESSLNGNPYNGIFQLYASPQANGFFFNSNLNFKTEHYAYWIDFFKDRLLNLEYRIYTSDYKTVEVPAGIQRTERHYLKPGKVDSVSFPIDQKFGNVSIELVSIDEKPSFVKLMASIYSDRNYAEPLPFNDLAEKLLSRS